MSRFKIGQKVVAIKGTRIIIKGNTYTIDGFSCCPGCGLSTVYLLENKDICNSRCDGKSGCNYLEISVRSNWAEILFAPLSNIADVIEYRLSVSIPAE